MSDRAVLVTGGQGQVGLELGKLDWDGRALVSPGRDALDISDRFSVRRFLEQHPISAIVNCAAFTAVDRAEDEIEPAYATNGFGAAWLAAESRRLGIPMVHVSTDYVFSGDGSGFRSEDGPVAPTSVYGASKLAGEIAVLAATDRAAIVRSAWIISPHRSNFLKTMLRLAGERDEISVVDDQRGCPTVAADLAHALQVIVLRLLDDPGAPTGIFHFVNSGEASWAELAEVIMHEAQANGLPAAKIVPVPSSAYPTKVARPADSRLSTERLNRDYGIRPRPWQEAVTATVREVARQGQRTT
jgi:dTDP-4-dehydrorhamnose reductase